MSRFVGAVVTLSADDDRRAVAIVTRKPPLQHRHRRR